jgi:hypothetical protein
LRRQAAGSGGPSPTSADGRQPAQKSETRPASSERRPETDGEGR